MTETAPAALPFSPSAALLGWKLVAHDAAKGWVRIAFDAKAEFLNPAGFVQGGFVQLLARTTANARLVPAKRAAGLGRVLIDEYG